MLNYLELEYAPAQALLGGLPMHRIGLSSARFVLSHSDDVIETNLDESCAVTLRKYSEWIGRRWRIACRAIVRVFAACMALLMSHTALASISCSVSFSTPQNTQKNYALTGTWNGSAFPAGTDNYNCDPLNVGIASDAAGDDYGSNATPVTTTHSGTLEIFGPTSTNHFIYTPATNFSGTDTATFYIYDNGLGTWTATGALTITVVPAITLSPTSVPAATVAVAYSQTITASGGTSPYTYAVTSGSLPAGMSLSTAGTLSGTPTAGGTFNFTVRATDASSTTGSQAYSLTVAAPTITIGPNFPPNQTVGQATSLTFTASGGTSPYTYAITAGSLPAGISLSSAGVISGTATQGGTFNFTITATDSSTGTGPYTGSHPYTLLWQSATVSTSPTTIPNGAVGTSYSQTISGTGGTSPYTFQITGGALPAGLSLNGSTGVISGTPTAAGSFTVFIVATDSSTGTGPYFGGRSYSFSIAAPTVSLSPSSLPGGTVAAAYSQSVSGSGGTSPYTYAVTAGSLPTGLSLNASTGAVSGTPTA